MNKMFALYHGDNILTIGTIKELAKYLNVKDRTIKFYSTPTYRKSGKFSLASRTFRRILLPMQADSSSVIT